MILPIIYMKKLRYSDWPRAVQLSSVIPVQKINFKKDLLALPPGEMSHAYIINKLSYGFYRLIWNYFVLVSF